MERTIDRLRGEQTLGPEEPFLCHTLCELGATEMQTELAGSSPGWTRIRARS